MTGTNRLQNPGISLVGTIDYIFINCYPKPLYVATDLLTITDYFFAIPPRINYRKLLGILNGLRTVGIILLFIMNPRVNNDFLIFKKKIIHIFIHCYNLEKIKFSND